MRLLELPDDVLAMVERGELSEGHARAILAVPDHGDRRQLARKIVRQGLSVRAAERAARWAGARTRPRRPTRVDPELAGRVRTALTLLTGIEPKVAANRVELPIEDETRLAELAEALERLLP
jgi:ParB family chromosome partitioning protein